MADIGELLFSGLRVLDVGTRIVAPVAATILADYGASVIKVEIPTTGDPYRRLPETPFMPRSDVNYTWIADALADPRFADQEARIQYGVAFVELLRDMFRSRRAVEWMQLFRAHDVPVTLVTHVEDLPAATQLTVSDIVTPPAGGTATDACLINHPVNVRGLPRVGPLPAPEIGQHFVGVLAELGYEPAEIERLRSDGVI